MADYKITMHEKKSDGTYDTLYPKTTSSQIIGDFMQPQIVATSETGATVRVKLGDIVITAEEQFGTWTFNLPNLGDWVVEAVGIRSKTVSVTEVKQYSVYVGWPVYGAVWDGSSSTKWTRTDDSSDFSEPVPYVLNATSYGSPFDNILPWSGMVRSTDVDAGEVVAIPKFYYKWTFSGNSIGLQISPNKKSGFYVSPAHMDRRDGNGERDFVYVGRYHSSDGNLRSITNAVPRVSNTIEKFRTSIHSLGSNVWQNDYTVRVTIWMLYLVEYADWDSQSSIGYGCGNDTSRYVSGRTDSMPYHTGTNKSSKTTYGVTQYRHIEGLWDNVYDFCDGVKFQASNIYSTINPNEFATDTGTDVGFSRATSSGYIKRFNQSVVNGLEWFIYPTEVGGTSSTYVPDYCSHANGERILNCGGYYSNNQNFGMFYLNGAYTSTSSSVQVGSRIMVLPSSVSPTTITFSITTEYGTNYFNVSNGTTWTQFVNSEEVEVLEIQIQVVNNEIHDKDDGTILRKDGVIVKATDAITSGSFVFS